MSRLASIQIDTWKDKYVVTADFGSLHIVSSKEFEFVFDALQEMYKLIGRELVKYEAGINSHYSREL